MDKKLALLKGLCATVVFACTISGHTPAFADVKCFSDGSYARTPDVSKEEAEAYCATIWNLGTEEDFSQPLEVTPPSQQTSQVPPPPQTSGAEAVPAPAPVALILGGFAVISGLRKRRLNQQAEPAKLHK